MHEASKALRLLQLTDPHLFADPSAQLLGITTRASFEAVLKLALTGPRAADALVLTGDLVHDESPGGYRYLRQTLEAAGIPYYCLPGNHDLPSLMNEWLGTAAVGPVTLRRLASWNLIFLDSSLPNLNSGHLGREQIEDLRGLLSDNRESTLIFLHHHPLPVGSTWIDTMGVDNGVHMLKISDPYPQVKGVVFGHVHQAFSRTFGGCQVLGAPSTCIQFLPGSAGFALDERLPGYRDLMLYPDGRLTTQIIRLDQYPERHMHTAEGY